jgi:hypothetical protein
MERQCPVFFHTTGPTKKFIPVTIIATYSRRRTVTLPTAITFSTPPLPMQTVIEVFIAKWNKSLEGGILGGGLMAVLESFI